MWQRRTFYECVAELEQAAHNFRQEWRDSGGKHTDQLDFQSRRGVEVLRALAAAVRSEQDYGLTDRGESSVGVLKHDVPEKELASFIASYRPPYVSVNGFSSLTIREALNKIMHADPRRAGFYIDDSTHDLLLSGTGFGRSWVAVVSVIDLCAAIKQLADRNTDPC